MCRRKDSIAAMNCAAARLTKACTARRTFVVLQADQLRDPSTLKHLPGQPPDFDELLDRLDQPSRKETKQ